MASTETTLHFEVLDRADPDVANLIRREYQRQANTMELIACEAEERVISTVKGKTGLVVVAAESAMTFAFQPLGYETLK